MATKNKAKLKLLYIRQILEEETDAERGLTMTQLIDRLAELGIPAERKGIYRDIETLRDFGIDIRTYPRNPVQYAIARRDFSLSELMLLVDAVESCKFLTSRQSRALVTNLKLLASDHEREKLDRRIHVAGRITSKRDGVFDAIDAIHEAMRLGRKVEFVYVRYGMDGARTPTRGGRPHIVTPVGVTFSDGFYYLTAWNDEHGNMTEYRVDRMERLRVSNEASTRNDEIARYAYEGDEWESFGRFGGEPVTATLLVQKGKMEIVMDRFGDAIQLYPHDDETAKAVVRIRKSEPFFGWIAGLGGTVRIHGPKSLKDEYRAYLRRLLEE